MPGEVRYPHLFSPVTIRGKVYKNRMKAAPTMFVHANYFIPEISVYSGDIEPSARGFRATITDE